MKIDFEESEVKKIKEFKGGIGELLLRKFEDDTCRIMRSTLTPGSTIGLHRHEGDCEVIYVLSGTGVALCGGKKEKLVKGTVHYCPKGCEHTVINTGKKDLNLFAIVIKQF